MDKVLELLGVEKLDESSQKELKDKLQDIIDVKAKEVSDGKLNEERQNLIKEYEEKFEEYKQDITSKFSNFVDTILNEEMVIPDKIKEFARKGELYSDLIEQFKTRLSIDEGLLDEEVKNLLKEAKDEITRLRGELDEKISSELELQKDAQEMAASLYLREKCDGLTESQKKQVLELLEGITDKDEIDKKFKVVLDTVSEKESDEKEDVSEEKDEKEDVNEEGKGVSEVETDKNDDVSEADNPFDSAMKQYLAVLQEGI